MRRPPVSTRISALGEEPVHEGQKLGLPVQRYPNLMLPWFRDRAH